MVHGTCWNDMMLMAGSYKSAIVFMDFFGFYHLIRETVLYWSEK